jgi:hypothetical protein
LSGRVVVTDTQPGMLARPVVIFGPERWSTAAGADWSYWDLWFCVVCLVDHDGDWDALDHAIVQTKRSDGEQLWSHLCDLLERLGAAGLTAASLAGPHLREPKLRGKARTKVMKSSLYPRDLTPAMADPPSARLIERALFGSWPRFPSSPRPHYDVLARMFHIGHDRYGDGWATRTLSDEIAETEAVMSRQAGADVAQQVAVHRAALTFYYQAAEVCDDSYGGLSDVVHNAVTRYASIDWPAAGIDAEVFWSDLHQWAVMAGNYGLLHRAETDVLRRADVGRHLDLVDTILAELAAGYRAARMGWHADQAQALRAHAVVAAGELSRFESTAAAIGTDSWTALDTMVDAALTQHRADVAIKLLDAADRPGPHQQWLRRRRAGLAATA